MRLLYNIHVPQKTVERGDILYLVQNIYEELQRAVNK